MKFWQHVLGALLLIPATMWAGPYSQGLNDPGNVYDAPIPGFVGVDGDGIVSENNVVNPIFKSWAGSVVTYQPSPGVSAGFKHPEKTLGPVTGDNFDIATLGDLDGTQMAASVPPGFITLQFAVPIVNGLGKDFAVFENGFVSEYTTGEGSRAGEMFAELAYVEISTDGIHFSRFPGKSLTAEAVGAYGTLDPTDVYNLAGKHANAYGDSWGTPFDLDDLLDDDFVLDGSVDLMEINYVRIVDIPGNGHYLDSLGNPVYDAWLTWGSGGFDLEAVGVINQVPEPSAYALLGLAGILFLTLGYGKARNSARS